MDSSSACKHSVGCRVDPVSGAGGPCGKTASLGVVKMQIGDLWIPQQCLNSLTQTGTVNDISGHHVMVIVKGSDRDQSGGQHLGDHSDVWKRLFSMLANVNGV